MGKIKVWFHDYLVLDGFLKMAFLVELTNAMMPFTLPITKHILVLLRFQFLLRPFLRQPAQKLELKL